MRIVTSILAWLLSLAFLGLAALLAGVGAGMMPDYEQGGAYDVLQRTVRFWPFVAAGAALVAALIVNPLTSSMFGLAGKWGRAAAGVVLMLAGVVGAMFMDQKEFSGALDQYEKQIVAIENRHEARMTACGLQAGEGSTDPHMSGRGLGGGQASGKSGVVTYAAQAYYDEEHRAQEQARVDQDGVYLPASEYRTCVVGPSGGSVILTDEMIRNAAGGPITVTVDGSRITVPASDVRTAQETARKAVADQRLATALWTRCTYVVDTLNYKAEVIRPADPDAAHIRAVSRGADPAAAESALATCVE